MTQIFLFLAYAAATAAALYAARQLAPREPLHASALAMMLLFTNLMLPPTFAGLVGVLTPLGLAIAGISFWSLEIAVARKLTSLPAERRTGGFVHKWNQWINLLGIGLILFVLLLLSAYTLFLQEDLASPDALFHYVPNIINVVQSGSIFEMNGFLPYFPLGFEAILSWEITLNHSFHTVNGVHNIMYLGGTLYGILLLRWLLRNESPIARNLGTIGGTLLLLTLNTTIVMVGEVGKNDLLIWLCSLAGVYYLFRYWCDTQDRRFLTLLGITLGLAASTKLTAFGWIGVLGAIHVILRFRERRLQHIVRDGLSVGLPIAVIFLPWGLRAVAGLELGTALNLTQLGTENTVITQIAAPQFTRTVALWVPWFATIIISLALVLWLPTRLRAGRIAAGVVLLLSLTLIFVDRLFTLYQVGIAITFGAGILILAWSCQFRDTFARLLQMLMGIVLLSMLVFVFTPFSACVTCDELHRYTAILYRYTPATNALFCFALILLVVVRVTDTEKTHLTAPSSSLSAPLTVWLSQAGLLILILGIFLQQMLMPRPLPAFLNMMPASTQEVLPLRDWIDANIRNSRIYSINEAPIVLYGRGLSNRVHYVLPGYEGYYGDQPYRWHDIQSLIEEYDLDYIVVKFGYIDIMQAALRDTPEVTAEIALLRQNLTTVYDNGTTVVFAVHADASGSASPSASVARR